MITAGVARARALALRSRAIVMDAHGIARLRVRCRAPAPQQCAGVLRLGAARRHESFGRTRFRIAAGHQRVLRIRITLRVRRALRGSGRLLRHAVVAARRTAASPGHDHLRLAQARRQRVESEILRATQPARRGDARLIA